MTATLHAHRARSPRYADRRRCLAGRRSTSCTVDAARSRPSGLQRAVPRLKTRVTRGEWRHRVQQAAIRHGAWPGRRHGAAARTAAPSRSRSPAARCPAGNAPDAPALRTAAAPVVARLHPLSRPKSRSIQRSEGAVTTPPAPYARGDRRGLAPDGGVLRGAGGERGVRDGPAGPGRGGRDRGLSGVHQLGLATLPYAQVRPLDISKCRCGPVELPVLPTAPSRCPAVTRWPASTWRRDRWQ